MVTQWTAKEIDRFLSYTRKTAACWAWVGRALKKTNRGQFTCRTKRLSAPRMAYSMFVGPIPEGLVVMHTCDNPNCVKPSHLLLGTQYDNVKDRDAKGRNRLSHTHCHRGHALSGDNVRHNGPDGRWRICRTCAREYARSYRQVHQ